MTHRTNFNTNPYYDDFDGTKKFLRTMFKPGYAVQARELTQIQTQMQNQIEKFGSHVFQNGSLVLGGQTALQDATYLKIDSTYFGNTVNYANFQDKTILSVDQSKRAEVILAIGAEGTDPITLMVKQIYGNPFVAGDTIKTDVSGTTFATIQSGGVGVGQVFSINEGTFFYDGFFITNTKQIVAIDKYNNTSANVRVGFEISESFVTATSDTSLLDPAQDASNYQAPGADRFKIDLVLSTRSLNSIDDTHFIELARIEGGKLIKVVRYPIYSSLEDTLARRTYDESGNYIVRPFAIALDTNSSNTAQTNILLSPGKAYVFGYEFETTGTTTVVVDKPRTYIDVNNQRITADYGNFVYTTNHKGSFPIDSLKTIDLHAVQYNSINLTSSATYNNTKIGVARVKSIEYEGTGSSSNTSTNIYRTYLFDVSVGSITGNVGTSGGASTSNTTHVLLSNTAVSYFSTTNDAYKGAKFRIISGQGLGNQVKTITGFNATSQFISLNEPLTVAPLANTQFAIDFELNDVESLVVANATTQSIISASNIDVRSKDLATVYEDVFLSDVINESQIFPLGQHYIVPGRTGDISLSYKRLFENQTFAGGQTTFTLGSGEAISSASTESSINQNYYIAVTDKRTSTAYANGEIVRASNVSVDSGTSTITVSGASDMLANVIAVIDVTNPSAKTKTYRVANPVIQTPSAPDLINVFGNNTVNVFTQNCQTHIANTFVVKIPDTPQSLFVSDVFKLNTILDFRGLVITQANVSSAVDITSRYTLINGQKDSFYDHAYIKLKPGQLPPDGPLMVSYDRFISADAGGFFTADSYVNGGLDYGNIPKFISPTTGFEYNLRDCLDFRPVRSDGSSIISFYATKNPKIPENGSDIIVDYSYYLPRMDKVVLNKNRSFEVIKGVPNLKPKEPEDKSSAMTMFVLACPPYISNVSEIQVSAIDHKRYTMRDIGILEKRISNLEYYTSLSQLEQSTLTKQDLTILDSQNLPRFKNGIIVDAFSGHSVGDVFGEDYCAAIDPVKKEMRPTFNISSHGFTFNSNSSTGVALTGPVLGLAYTEKSFINQAMASKPINVNPFNVINFVGKIKLTPSSDVWVDTVKKPDVIVNTGGEQDAWNRLIGNQSNWSYEYGSWETKWTGITTSNQREWEQTFAHGIPRRILDRTVTDATGTSSRQIIASRVTTSTVTRNLGDRVVDMSVIPYMRNTHVAIRGTGFKPNSTLYIFFDGLNIDQQVLVANRLTLASSANNFIATVPENSSIGSGENLQIKNADTGTIIGTSNLYDKANNVIDCHWDSSTTGASFNPSGANLYLIGTVSGANVKIISYEHNHGITVTGTSNTITLQTTANGANNIDSYVGAKIHVKTYATNPWTYQTRTITNYNVSTRVATVDSNWDFIPTSSSVYRIGNMKATMSGTVSAGWHVKASTFRTGEKRLLLIDNQTGDIPSSTTNGDAIFTSQGTIKTTEASIISSVVPTIERSITTQTQPASQTLSISEPRVVGYWDPLAQTFLVEPTNNPQGVFVTKIRLCFKSKDSTIPVTVQIRPTVNGYPHSSMVYPLATKSLTPDRVNITESPSLSDPTKYTEFVFDSPVCLQPGEHSFVILANSKNYELYVGEIGKPDLVTSRQISDQPYGGSLFISQNGSTWTADQSTDIMFQVFVAEYSTSPATAYFNINYPSTNTVFDLVRLGTTESVVVNTSIGYEINSTRLDNGTMTGFNYITPNESTSLEDGFGRRILLAGANTSFNVRVTMETTNRSISPTIDTSRFNIIAIENIINNMGLSNNDIIVTNGGTGYVNVNNVSIAFSGSGSGAAAVANVTSNGTIDRIYVTNAGSGYTTNPIITISTLAGPGTGATAIVNGETSKSGGNGQVRYITRRVTLNDGFDSGDLRVYLTAYKPQGAKIYVYYKVLSKSDPDEFDNKNYQIMTQLGDANFTSLSQTDYRELTFAPGANGIANNFVTYTSGSTAYNTFKTFAIKVVLAGTDTVSVPKIRDFRAIALPTGA